MQKIYYCTYGLRTATAIYVKNRTTMETLERLMPYKK